MDHCRDMPVEKVSCSLLSPTYFEYSIEIDPPHIEPFFNQLVLTNEPNSLSGCCDEESWLTVTSLSQLPPTLRKKVHVGSRVQTFTVFELERNLLGLHQPKEIRRCFRPNIFADFDANNAAFAKIEFWSDLIPCFESSLFNIADGFSTVCMVPSCKMKIAAFNRSHCRCCGILVCHNCRRYRMKLPNSKNPDDKSHKVCTSCFEKFNSDPRLHYSVETVMTLRSTRYEQTAVELLRLLDLQKKKEAAIFLGLDPTRYYTSEEIKHTRKRLLLKQHPDRRDRSMTVEGTSVSATDNSDANDVLVQLLAACDTMAQNFAMEEAAIVRFKNTSGISDAAGFCESCGTKFQLNPLLSVYYQRWRHHCTLCTRAVCSNCAKFIELNEELSFGAQKRWVCSPCDSRRPKKVLPFLQSVSGEDGGTPMDICTFLAHLCPGSPRSSQNIETQHNQIYELDIYATILQDRKDSSSLFVTLSLRPNEGTAIPDVTAQLASYCLVRSRSKDQFKSLRKHLQDNLGSRSDVLPSLLQQNCEGCELFLNALLAHPKLRYNAIVRIFCVADMDDDVLPKSNGSLIEWLAPRSLGPGGDKDSSVRYRAIENGAGSGHASAPAQSVSVNAQAGDAGGSGSFTVPPELLPRFISSHNIISFLQDAGDSDMADVAFLFFLYNDMVRKSILEAHKSQDVRNQRKVEYQQRYQAHQDRRHRHNMHHDSFDKNVSDIESHQDRCDGRIANEKRRIELQSQDLLLYFSTERADDDVTAQEDRQWQSVQRVVFDEGAAQHALDNQQIASHRLINEERIDLCRSNIDARKPPLHAWLDDCTTRLLTIIRRKKFSASSGGSLDVASTIAQNEEILSSLRNTADEELTAELGALQEESRYLLEEWDEFTSKQVPLFDHSLEKWFHLESKMREREDLLAQETQLRQEKVSNIETDLIDKEDEVTRSRLAFEARERQQQEMLQSLQMENVAMAKSVSKQGENHDRQLSPMIQRLADSISLTAQAIAAQQSCSIVLRKVAPVGLREAAKKLLDESTVLAEKHKEVVYCVTGLHDQKAEEERLCRGDLSWRLREAFHNERTAHEGAEPHVDDAFAWLCIGRRQAVDIFIRDEEQRLQLDTARLERVVAACCETRGLLDRMGDHLAATQAKLETHSARLDEFTELEAGEMSLFAARKQEWEEKVGTHKHAILTLQEEDDAEWTDIERRKTYLNDTRYESSELLETATFLVSAFQFETQNATKQLEILQAYSTRVLGLEYSPFGEAFHVQPLTDDTSKLRASYDLNLDKAKTVSYKLLSRMQTIENEADTNPARLQRFDAMIRRKDERRTLIEADLAAYKSAVAAFAPSPPPAGSASPGGVVASGPHDPAVLTWFENSSRSAIASVDTLQAALHPHIEAVQQFDEAGDLSSIITTLSATYNQLKSMCAHISAANSCVENCFSLLHSIYKIIGEKILDYEFTLTQKLQVDELSEQEKTKLKREIDALTQRQDELRQLRGRSNTLRVSSISTTSPMGLNPFFDNDLLQPFALLRGNCWESLGR